MSDTAEAVEDASTDPVSLDIYVDELRTSVDKFEKYYKKQLKAHPELFTEGLYIDEWEEQFTSWLSIGAPEG